MGDFLVQEATRERLFDIKKRYKKCMDFWLSKKASKERGEVVGVRGGYPYEDTFQQVLHQLLLLRSEVRSRRG